MCLLFIFKQCFYYLMCVQINRIKFTLKEEVIGSKSLGCLHRILKPFIREDIMVKKDRKIKHAGKEKKYLEKRKVEITEKRDKPSV